MGDSKNSIEYRLEFLIDFCDKYALTVNEVRPNDFPNYGSFVCFTDNPNAVKARLLQVMAENKVTISQCDPANNASPISPPIHYEDPGYLVTAKSKEDLELRLRWFKRTVIERAYREITDLSRQLIPNPKEGNGNSIDNSVIGLQI
ncbi:hypothetical protein J4401_02395 [Candidatus Woesearchaeota archaeon]|nr:hypothetical protein [Candidatus Woesearchaeota archaeon]